MEIGVITLSTLEHTIYGIRRGWRITGTFLFSGAFAAAVVAGLFADMSRSSLKIPAIFAIGLWALVFGLKVHRYLRSGKSKTHAITGREELEIGMLLVVAVHAFLQVAGGFGSPLQPLVFVLVAFLVVYTQQWVGFTLVALTIGLEMSLAAVGASNADLIRGLLNAVFVACFALINLVFTRTEISRMRRAARRQIENTRSDMDDDARDFRLTSAASDRRKTGNRAKEEARLSHCTVGEVRRSMYHHVDLLKRTMGLHTCLLMWIEGNGDTLRRLECVTDATDISSRKVDRGEGVIGAVLRNRAPVCLKGLRPGYPGIPYYESESSVTDFLGVPIIEGESLRGVLCADRNDNRPFGDVEKENLNAAVESILQIISNERIFSQLRRAKFEQGKLLDASESLTRALAQDEVIDAALQAAGRIANYDIAAITTLDEKGRQVVAKAIGEDTIALEGEVIGDNGSLASSVQKNRHYLPYKGVFDPKQQVIFSKKTQKVFGRMRSVLVLPLIAGEEMLGTLTLATAAPTAYTDNIRTTIQVMINQLGTALQNAMMVKHLEEMATTDGLTSLPNRRIFQEELNRQTAQSTRFNTETSVILCDVDKFKNVNDTFGHPVGDQVLKAFGDILRRNVVRDTDLPARYGGEEFTVICAGTGTSGAVKLAEKIRRDLEGQVFHTDKGDLRCTTSMGVATLPIHARSQDDLLKRADAALYAAKEGGRNQVRVWEKAFGE